MSFPSLPYECLSNILFFLNTRTLYNCLFVNRHWCRHSVPIIWRNPFDRSSIKVANTLIACLNEDEISSLIPYAINFNNDQPPLFEYGKFVKTINHKNCVRNVITWLKLSSRIEYEDNIVQKLVNVIYHMIMRQGSNLQELNLRNLSPICINLPKFSVLTTFKPGIINLKSLHINDTTNQDIMKFLSIVSKFCNGIINFKLWRPKHSALIKISLDIIRSKPLEEILIYFSGDSVKEIIYALESRSNTLKELKFENVDFQQIDLSFISKMERLERLKFSFYKGFAYKYQNKRKSHLKELWLWHDGYYNSNAVGSFELGIKLSVVEAINSLCNKMLLKLTLNIVTPETVRAVKESCPNINFLHIHFYLGQSLDQIIPIICELSTLKILNIGANHEIDRGLLIKILGDHLTSVEYLLFSFYIDLPSFEYFTNNCKANLKKLSITVNKDLRRDCLKCINNFQKVHNSLKVLGINHGYPNKFCWEGEDLDLLKSQGIEIVPFVELNFLFY